ncbi:MAG: 4Fe-4S dicluster domain-containing protein [Lachnospiraceae bacterium]
MERVKKKVQIGADCVACGCCVKSCPRDALHIERGLYAQVKKEACIGCGRCVTVCPAQVMELVQVPDLVK